jgi:hypothetical protein
MITLRKFSLLITVLALGLFCVSTVVDAQSRKRARRRSAAQVKTTVPANVDPIAVQAFHEVWKIWGQHFNLCGNSLVGENLQKGRIEQADGNMIIDTEPLTEADRRNGIDFYSRPHFKWIVARIKVGGVWSQWEQNTGHSWGYGMSMGIESAPEIRRINGQWEISRSFSNPYVGPWQTNLPETEMDWALKEWNKEFRPVPCSVIQD